MNKQSLSPEEKDDILLKGVRAMLEGKQTEGELLKHLRKDLLGITQQRYADLVGISRRTLSDIENGKAQPSTTILNQVFKPLGLKLALVPRSPHLIRKLTNNTAHK